MVTPKMKLTIVLGNTVVGTRFRETYAFDNTNTRNTESRNNFRHLGLNDETWSNQLGTCACNCYSYNITRNLLHFA